MALILKDGSLKEIHVQKIEELTKKISSVKVQNDYGLRVKAIKELHQHSKELFNISLRICIECGISTTLPQEKTETIINIINIINKVNEHFKVDILKRTRKKETVIARQIAHKLAKMFTLLSLKEIGEKTGGYDHTTVLHSFKTVHDLIDTDKGFAFHFQTLVHYFSEKLYEENEVEILGVPTTNHKPQTTN